MNKPFSTEISARKRRRRIGHLIGLLGASTVLILLSGGCGMLSSSGQVASGQKPHFSSSINLPFGK